MRAIPLELLAEEAGVSPDLVKRYVALGELRPLPDGRFDARDAVVLSTVNALLAAGTRPEDLEWAIESGRLGLSVVGHLFPDPPERTETYEQVTASLGPAGDRLGPAYAAMGLPEPATDRHLRADEARIVSDYARMWAAVDPGGDSDVRIARLAGDGLRRLPEASAPGWSSPSRGWAHGSPWSS